MSKDI
jgi:hypothetical protein